MGGGGKMRELLGYCIWFLWHSVSTDRGAKYQQYLTNTGTDMMLIFLGIHTNISFDFKFIFDKLQVNAISEPWLVDINLQGQLNYRSDIFYRHFQIKQYQTELPSAHTQSDNRQISSSAAQIIKCLFKKSPVSKFK